MKRDYLSGVDEKAKEVFKLIKKEIGDIKSVSIWQSENEETFKKIYTYKHLILLMITEVAEVNKTTNWESRTMRELNCISEDTINDIYAYVKHLDDF